jgi:hypothetical protein
MSKRVAATLFLAAFSPFCISASGCMVEDESAPTEIEEGEDEVYTVTAVELDEVNGNRVVGTYTETLSEQLERNARLAELEEQGLGQDAQAISHTNPCLAGMFVGQQIIIYDATNYTGNMICFTGTGIADLNSYCRTSLWGQCLDNWGGNVRSFKTGNEAARFGQISSGADPTQLCCDWDCDARGDNTNVTPASACEQDADIDLIDRGAISCDPNCF